MLMRHTERIHWRIMEKLKILNRQRDEGRKRWKMCVRRDVSSNPETQFSAAGGKGSDVLHIWESLTTCALQNGIMCSSRRWQRRVRAAVAAYPDPGRDRCLPNWLQLKLSQIYWIGQWVPIMNMTKGCCS